MIPIRRATRAVWIERAMRAMVVSASALALAAPRAALACAVCGGGNPANRFAFFMSTIALSLLPLGLFAGGFLWLRSRLGQRPADEPSEREAPVPPDTPQPTPRPASREIPIQALNRTLPHPPAR